MLTVLISILLEVVVLVYVVVVSDVSMIIVAGSAGRRLGVRVPSCRCRSDRVGGCGRDATVR